MTNSLREKILEYKKPTLLFIYGAESEVNETFAEWFERQDIDDLVEMTGFHEEDYEVDEDLFRDLDISEEVA